MARQDSLLNTIFSFARSSRILIYIRANFHSFDILSIRFVVRECICDDFLFTDMSTNVRFRSASPVSWMLVPLPWRVSYRLALLLCFPKSHAVPDSHRDQVIHQKDTKVILSCQIDESLLCLLVTSDGIQPVHRKVLLVL